MDDLTAYNVFFFSRHKKSPNFLQQCQKRSLTELCCITSPMPARILPYRNLSYHTYKQTQPIARHLCHGKAPKQYADAVNPTSNGSLRDRPNKRNHGQLLHNASKTTQLIKIKKNWLRSTLEQIIHTIKIGSSIHMKTSLKTTYRKNARTINQRLPQT